MCEQCTAPEEWRAVVGYESRYAVSNLGRIMRTAPGPGTRAGHILTPQNSEVRPGKPPYYSVRLSDPTHRFRGKRVHVLMAEAFLGPKPSPQHEVNHIDGDSLHNVVTNLEWTTHLENIRHAFRVGLVRQERRGVDNANARLTTEAVRDIRTSSLPREALATMYGVTPTTISHIKLRRTWRHVP